MSEFRELVKRFDKIRSYVREFYIYGFKTREDYQEKSSRTYDNERRRIESWFSDYIRQEYRADRKKSVSITLDSSLIAVNPLYQAWKTKSFTDHDILLHFFLLDLLRDGTPRGVETITDALQEQYQVLFDPQSVRRKLNEYEKEGLVTVRREGRRFLYAAADDPFRDVPELTAPLLDAVCFFQAAAPFGFVGSTILDHFQKSNTRFRFRHDFLVHTLEDEVLLPLTDAIQNRSFITVTVKNARRSTLLRRITGTPLRILVSTQTGRRYLCIRKQSSRRLACYRLDSIQEVTAGAPDPHYADSLQALEKNLPFTWGVSFGNSRKPETVCLRVALNEKTERYILNRLNREGRGGAVTRIESGVYEYTRTCWDASELLPWIRTFTGRILDFSCSNLQVEQRFWEDMRQMKALYQNDVEVKYKI